MVRDLLLQNMDVAFEHLNRNQTKCLPLHSIKSLESPIRNDFKKRDLIQSSLNGDIQNSTHIVDVLC